MGTVVVAIGLGFAGAMVLTSTQPVHKEPPAGFAKREQPIEAPTPAVAPAPAEPHATTFPAPAQAQAATQALETKDAKPAPETAGMAPTSAAAIIGRAPGRTTAADTVPAPSKKVEEVVGLQFAPPQPQTIEAPEPRTIAPAPAPVISTPEAKTPEPKTTKQATEIRTPDPAAKANPPKSDDAVKADALKKHPKVKKERVPTALAEKKKPAPTQEYVERRKREFVERRRQMEVDDDDEASVVVMERPRRREVAERPRREGGFFNFLGLFDGD